MASSGWRTGRPLTSDLVRNIQQFDFYQIVRLLLKLAPARPRRSHYAVLENDVRFHADVRQDFAPAEVTAVTLSPQRRLAEIAAKTPSPSKSPVVRFWLAGFCLDHRSGPLPEPHRELILHRMADKDRILADFLDIFNHRINYLRYRVKQHCNLNLIDVTPGKTHTTRYLLNLIGLGLPNLADRAPLEHHQLVGFAGLLANPRRNLPMVRNILRACLGAAVEICQFCGRWRRIEEDDRLRIGLSGNNQGLGRQSFLGHRAWDQHGMLLFTLGPLPWRQAVGLAHGPDERSRFRDLLMFLTDRRFDCLIRIKVVKAGIPRSRLKGNKTKKSEKSDPRGRLGLTTWLVSRPAEDGPGREDDPDPAVDDQLTFLIRVNDQTPPNPGKAI